MAHTAVRPEHRAFVFDAIAEIRSAAIGPEYR